MSKAVKRTDPTTASAEDTESTRVIATSPGNAQSGSGSEAEETRVFNDHSGTGVYRDEGGSKPVERTRVMDGVGQADARRSEADDETRSFEAEQVRREEEAQRRREAAEARARELSERDRALGNVEAPSDPDPVVVAPARPSTDKAWPSIGLFLFRLVVAAIMGVHGFQHLTQRDVTMEAVQATGLPYSQYGVWVLGVAECLAALALLLGLFTRVAGLGVAIIAVLALVYLRWGNFNIFQEMGFKGELEVLLAASGLLLFFVGSGGWAVDAARRRRRAERKLRD